MKRFLVLFAVLSLAACANKAKTTDAAKPAPMAKEAKAAPAKMESKAGSITCSLNKDQRIVEVRPAGSGCEVIYKKFGSEENIATAVKGTDHCMKVQERMAANLKTAGFKCE